MSSKNIYLFYGEDTYSIWQKAKRWQEEFLKKYGELNLHLFEGEDISAEELFLAINSASFFSEKKLIIVRGFLEKGGEQEQKKIAEKIETLGEDNIIVFCEYVNPDARTTLFKKIKKIGTLEDFKVLIGPQLIDWVQKKVTQGGGNIGLEEAEFLAENVGPNLWQMEQEINKLLLYCENKTIKTDAIKELVSPNLHASVFKLTDYLGQKRPKESLETLNSLLSSGEDMMKIFFMMVRQFRLLLQVQDCLEKKFNPKEIMVKMKEHPFVVSNIIQQSKNFNSSQLKKIYRILLKIDSSIKNGKIKISTGDQTELRLALEKFMIDLCYQKN